MSMFNKRSHEVPGLNTASLPDLIFSVLFFFMIVTHMRKVMLKVKYKVPQGTELTRLTKKTTVSYIYIGRPVNGGGANGSHSYVQLNDKIASTDEVEDYVSTEKKNMAPEDVKQMTVSIRADRTTKMGIITDIKQALRRADVLNINYSATEQKNNSK